MMTRLRKTTSLLRRSMLAAAVVVAAFPLAQAHAQSGSAHPRVKLNTSMGDIVMELYPDKAPKTVENFLQYVRDKHYDGTIFHRDRHLHGSGRWL